MGLGAVHNFLIYLLHATLRYVFSVLLDTADRLAGAASPLLQGLRSVSSDDDVLEHAGTCGRMCTAPQGRYLLHIRQRRCGKFLS